MAGDGAPVGSHVQYRADTGDDRTPCNCGNVGRDFVLQRYHRAARRHRVLSEAGNAQEVVKRFVPLTQAAGAVHETTATGLNPAVNAHNRSACHTELALPAAGPPGENHPLARSQVVHPGPISSTTPVPSWPKTIGRGQGIPPDM